METNQTLVDVINILSLCSLDNIYKVSYEYKIKHNKNSCAKINLRKSEIILDENVHYTSIYVIQSIIGLLKKNNPYNKILLKLELLASHNLFRTDSELSLGGIRTSLFGHTFKIYPLIDTQLKDYIEIDFDGFRNYGPFNTISDTGNKK